MSVPHGEFLTACHDGLTSMVKHCLDTNAFEDTVDLNLLGRALISACENGHDNVIELLISKGADVNFCYGSSGHTGLHRICVAGRNMVVCLRLLLQRGADPNMRTNNGTTPLLFLVNHTIMPRQTLMDTVKLLIEYGADPTIPNDRGDTAMKVACENKELSAIFRNASGGGQATKAAGL